MTQQPPTVSDPILKKSGFTTDFKNYENDLKEYHYLCKLSYERKEKNGKTKRGVLREAYHEAKDHINGEAKNPWLIFIEVMQLILDPGTNLANNNLDIYGQENKCQSALLKCQNDLQNITTQKGNKANGLIAEAHGLNQLMTNLNTKGKSVFGKGTNDLITNLSTIRDQIYISGGKEGLQNNPAENASTVYFDTSGAAGKMSSYGQMIDNLSVPGDPENAIEANTGLTNAFNTNTSILQSASQRSKEMLSQWINTVKTLASGGAMISSAIRQVSSAAQQNMRPQ